MRISTPLGELTERVEFDPGFESRWGRERMIKSVEDYAIVKYICDHTELEPTPQEYLEADSTMGEQGIIAGGLPPIPLLWLQAEGMGTKTWCMGMMQHPDEFDELHESVMRLYRRRREIAADSPAEVIWFADSLSGTLVSPRLFDRYCRDTYEYGCTLSHQAGIRPFGWGQCAHQGPHRQLEHRYRGSLHAAAAGRRKTAALSLFFLEALAR